MYQKHNIFMFEKIPFLFLKAWRIIFLHVLKWFRGQNKIVKFGLGRDSIHWAFVSKLHVCYFLLHIYMNMKKGDIKKLPVLTFGQLFRIGEWFLIKMTFNNTSEIIWIFSFIDYRENSSSIKKYIDHRYRWKSYFVDNVRSILTS